MTIDKITDKTLRQEVFEQLRESILGVQLLPGEVINLRNLAGKFRVSILHVREAVWQLESENILVIESNKKIKVNQLTGEEFKEVFEIRLLLESDAIGAACQKRPSSALPKSERAIAALHQDLKDTAAIILPRLEGKVKKVPWHLNVVGATI